MSEAGPDGGATVAGLGALTLEPRRWSASPARHRPTVAAGATAAWWPRRSARAPSTTLARPRRDGPLAPFAGGFDMPDDDDCLAAACVRLASEKGWPAAERE